MSQPAAGAVARTLPSFKFGKKQVFIPTHVVTLLHKPHLPPTWAMFQVPLRFSKFDLRDYLWNLYGLEAHRIRSVIKISPPSANKRAPSTKFMTIEMDKPFVWPAPPEDKEPWNHKLFTSRERASNAQWKSLWDMHQKGKLGDGKDPEERKTLRARAERLLRGQEVWKSDNTVDEKGL